MNKDIIIKFNYQDSELVVFIENNQIKFGYQKDGEISTNLTKKQQEIIAKVYNTMTINKNTAIDCGIFKIKGKQIKIFFDMTSKLYFFYELIKNELKIPAKEDLIMLNMCYNNQEEYVKDKNHDPKLEDYPGQDKEKKKSKDLLKSTQVLLQFHFL